MRILICDPVTSGFSHAAFNALMVLALSKQQNVTSITVALEKTQCEHPYIQAAFAKMKLPLKLVTLPIVVNGTPAQIKRAITIYRTLLLEERSGAPNLVCFLSADNTFSPLALSLLSASAKRPKPRFLFIFHNNIENTKKSLFKTALWNVALKGADTRLIVLSYFLKKPTAERFASARVVFIPHPCFTPFRACPQKPIPYADKHYDFLFLGRHAGAVNGQDFMNHFLQVCSAYQGDRGVRIAISANVINTNFRYLDNIEVTTFNYPVKDSIYDQLLRAARFVVIPPESATRFSASGVLADSITFGVPVIAPRSGPYADSATPFCKDFFYDQGDFSTALLHCLSITPEEYEKVSIDIFALRDHLSLTNTADRLSEVTA